jgi:hypothetical protein
MLQYAKPIYRNPVGSIVFPAPLRLCTPNRLYLRWAYALEVIQPFLVVVDYVSSMGSVVERETIAARCLYLYSLEFFRLGRGVRLLES